MSLVANEGLTIVNNLDLCDGVVTRVDPRNGKESTIDLAICNTFMLNHIVQMNIDEKEKWRLKKYGKSVTKTDHNTITVKLNLGQRESCKKEVISEKRYNVRNKQARKLMQENIENDSAIDSFFCAPCCDIDVEMNLFLKKWDDLMQCSFQTT